MTLYIGFPLLVCVLGLLAFALSGNEKITRPGLVAFGVGLLVTLWHIAGHTVRL